MGRESKSRFAILGMLSLGSMSGYDLKKNIEGSIGHFWHENYPQIYPVLKQLTEEALVTCEEDQREGHPERRVYTLTEKGWEVLRQWLGTPFDVPSVRNELLLKLFFGNLVPIPTSLEHIKQCRLQQEDLLRMYQQIETEISEIRKNDPRLPYWLLTLSQGKANAQMLLTWCDEAQVVLEQQENK